MTESDDSRPNHLFSIPREQWSATIVQAIVDIYELMLPGRIRSIYLIGSRSDGTPATVSDIDGCIIFRDSFLDEAEVEKGRSLLAICRRLSPIRLDFALMAEDDERLRTGTDVRLKLGGYLIFGQEIRDNIPLPSIAAYQAYIREWSNDFVRIMHDLEVLEHPLQYPDPTDQFYGYTVKRAVPWYPAEVLAGTKEFVATICWVATALLAFEAEVFVPSRSDCLTLCHQHLDRETANYINDVYQLCKLTWDYQLPSGAEERQQLSDLCKRALPFFNDYLSRIGLSN